MLRSGVGRIFNMSTNESGGEDRISSRSVPSSGQLRSWCEEARINPREVFYSMPSRRTPTRRNPFLLERDKSRGAIQSSAAISVFAHCGPSEPRWPNTGPTYILLKHRSHRSSFRRKIDRAKQCISRELSIFRPKFLGTARAANTSVRRK